MVGLDRRVGGRERVIEIGRSVVARILEVAADLAGTPSAECSCHVWAFVSSEPGWLAPVSRARDRIAL